MTKFNVGDVVVCSGDNHSDKQEVIGKSGVITSLVDPNQFTDIQLYHVKHADFAWDKCHGDDCLRLASKTIEVLYE